MERLAYQLRIDVDERHYETISELVGLTPKNYDYGWSYEIVLEERPSINNVIEGFIMSLKDKFESLAKLGVQSNDITVWIIYGYNGQCNMEFNPSTLKDLGDFGISLCISCYEVGHN